MKKILLFVFLLAGTALAAQKSQPIRVLFIGNSYTFYHNLPDLVSQIGESVGFPIDATACTKGSQRFTGHLQNGKLLRMLAAGGWDVRRPTGAERSPGPADRTGRRGNVPARPDAGQSRSRRKSAGAGNLLHDLGTQRRQ